MPAARASSPWLCAALALTWAALLWPARGAHRGPKSAHSRAVGDAVDAAAAAAGERGGGGANSNHVEKPRPVDAASSLREIALLQEELWNLHEEILELHRQIHGLENHDAAERRRDPQPGPDRGSATAANSSGVARVGGGRGQQRQRQEEQEQEEEDAAAEATMLSGRVCMDARGHVYRVGDKFTAGTSRCPCVCTAQGPLCPRPQCPRLPRRCVRVRHGGCCPVCREVRNFCVHRGRRYRLLDEFQPSPCEWCRCGSNGDVHCALSACPAPDCVDPVYEPQRCCPMCRHGPNCFAGAMVIPGGRDVRVSECLLCRCPGAGEWWRTDHHAACVRHGC
uniref:von Willebrand factor C domain-containing protein 2-like n=1 Tax=Petromyzon marinus TaxID=7757 RepID=A0AAJ7U915_PETMA|nr:von Willebrand factor C domain-containing protein 2-like [Petromyzon marinus]